MGPRVLSGRQRCFAIRWWRWLHRIVSALSAANYPLYGGEFCVVSIIPQYKNAGKGGG